MTGRNPIKNIDYALLAAVLVVCSAGVAFVYSASYGVPGGVNYPLRQAGWVGLGLVFMSAAFLVDYRHFIRLGYFLYIFSLGALVLVAVYGHAAGGARRWLALGGLAFQPSEFVKLTLLLALAKFFGNREGQVKSLKSLAGAGVLALVPMALVIQQPDLGTALLMMPVFFAVIFAAGVPAKYIAAILGSSAAVCPFLWFTLKDYQKSRLMVFWNPDVDPLGAGYSVNQSRIAIGSGGLFGRGWLSGTQTQLSFLPENRTDFIFSSVGEEFGFAGAALIIALYGFMAMRGMRIARESKDMGGALLASGISVMMVLHMFVNIGMAVGILPVVGMPLPLLSYGGSATVSALISLGFLINVRSRRFTY